MRGWTLPAVLALAAAGCSDDQDIDCSFEACGGDPVGAWTIDGACSEPGGGLEECPGATIVTSITYGGDWVFDADLTYRTDGVSLISLQGSFPISCLTDQLSCEQIGEAGVTCRTAGDRCDCNGVTSTPFERSGTWTALDGTLSLDGVAWAYCRSAGSLKMASSLSGETFVLSH